MLCCCSAWYGGVDGNELTLRHTKVNINSNMLILSSYIPYNWYKGIRLLIVLILEMAVHFCSIGQKKTVENAICYLGPISDTFLDCVVCHITWYTGLWYYHLYYDLNMQMTNTCGHWVFHWVEIYYTYSKNDTTIYSKQLTVMQWT